MAYGKTKVDSTGLNRLKVALKENTVGGTYLFYGEEDYLRERYLDMVKKRVLDENMETFNYHELDGNDLIPPYLEQTVDCLPMMAERTLIVVKDWDLMKLGEAMRSQLLEILAQLPSYCTLIFLYQSLEFKAVASIYLTSLKELACFVQFPRQDQASLVRWVSRHFQDLGHEISPQVALDLIFYCGDSMTELAGEIQKVGAYAKNSMITKDDILAVATPHIDAMAYAMTDAMGRGDFDNALGILHQLHQMKEPAIKIMASVSKMLRQVYGTKVAQNAGKNQSYVAELYGLRSYPAQKLMENARRFTIEWCRDAVVLSAKTDLRLKSSGKSGDVDQLMILTELVLKLAQ